MDNETWLIVAAVVLLVLIAGAFLGRRITATRQDRNRERAAELRAQADATHGAIKREQAEADAADARAREIRAEADRKQAEAKSLEAEVVDKRSALNEHVEHRDALRTEADRIDPDVTSGASHDETEKESPGHHRS